MNTTFVDRAVRQSRSVLAVASILGFASTAALADGRCQQLEALARQYAGVTLTSAQQQMKRQMVAWYNQNCRTRRAAAGN
jgi:hypothetical protein